MDQSSEWNGSSSFMTDCWDATHIQRKVHSEEVLGSFGSELSSVISGFLVK